MRVAVPGTWKPRNAASGLAAPVQDRCDAGIGVHGTVTRLRLFWIAPKFKKACTKKAAGSDSRGLSLRKLLRVLAELSLNAEDTINVVYQPRLTKLLDSGDFDLSHALTREIHDMANVLQRHPTPLRDI